MREIKFRAWDTLNERMVYDPYLFNVMPEYDKENYKGEYVFYEDWRDVEDGISRPCFIMQFTGLKDKNGKEIYEGDFIAVKFYPAWVERISWRGKPDAIAEVYWDLCGFGLKARGDEDYRYPGLWEVNYKHTKIIGNIYENSELLKEKQTA